jgi:3-oxoacyl-[acyl-carrier protein] reductase
MRLLEGRVAAVTGAGNGIGRAHARLLAEHGARVLVNDLDRAAAQAVADGILAAGGVAAAHAAGVDTREGAEGVAAAAIAAFGALDVLVNNAGNLRDRAFLNMSDEEFDAVWAVHVKGTFWCAQAAARHMRERGRGGVIINTSSGSHFGNFGQTNYAAAKGAIASMTYTWAIELARYGIRVNAICPVAATQMTRGLLGGGDADADAAAAAWAPERNSALVVYLASDEAANVSGQVFGTGGERLSHLVQPHYGKTLQHAGGWTVEAVRACFQREMPGEFGPFGILGKPYPFAAGVYPPPSAGEEPA